MDKMVLQRHIVFAHLTLHTKINHTRLPKALCRVHLQLFVYGWDFMSGTHSVFHTYTPAIWSLILKNRCTIIYHAKFVHVLIMYLFISHMLYVYSM